MIDMKNEYDFDSSDEEDIQNTIGNVPIEFYKGLNHIGYDTSGRPIQKLNVQSEIDSFLDKCDNPNRRCMIQDPNTGQMVQLTETDAMFIKQISCGLKHSLLYDPETDPDLDLLAFTRQTMETPVGMAPPRKSNYVPSTWDRRAVSRLVHSIKMGWMALPREKEESEIEPDNEYDYLTKEFEKECGENFWEEKEEYFSPAIRHMSQKSLQWLDPSYLDSRTKYERQREIIDPPPLPLPLHEESYVPPPEFLLTDEERKKRMDRFYDPSFNPCKHRCEPCPIPKQFESLRSVGNNGQCLVQMEKRTRDLVCARRFIKKQVQSSTNELLNACAPSIKDIDKRPYPNVLSQKMPYEDGIVMLTMSPAGNLAIISKRSIKIQNGANVLRHYQLSGEGNAIRAAWSPVAELLAVAVGTRVLIINPKFGVYKLDEMYKQANTQNGEKPEEDEASSAKKVKTNFRWNLVAASGKRSSEQMAGLEIQMDENMTDLAWHPAGDYLVAVTTTTSNQSSVSLHRISQCASQSVTGGSEKLVAARFSPHKSTPQLYIAQQRGGVHVYDLRLKKKVKTLEVSGVLSAMEMHPSEEHIVIGTEEGKVFWYDPEMGVRPFTKISVDRGEVKDICFHSKLPLVSCCTGNGSVVVLYAKVSTDFVTPPVVAAAKFFENLEKSGMLSIEHHPTKPHLYGAGASGQLLEFTSTHT